MREASEESFPASDPPSWAGEPERSPLLLLPAEVVNGYYFVADVDGSFCGLCLGMQVRARVQALLWHPGSACTLAHA
jgi:hypothetical protein